jgi:phosphoglycolate phosphatase-like HAD superfamily hydrolase
VPGLAATPEAIFFDVDGVLVDSLQVKGEAFALAFADYPSARDSIIELHLANGGVNRIDKISQIFANIIGREATEDDLSERVRAFSEAVVEQVVAAPAISGANAALAHWSALAPLHAVSATPAAELELILQRRSIAQYFTSINGWPPKKTDLLPILVRRFGYTPKRCITVGDSAEDEAAASAAGTLFVRVAPIAEERMPGAAPVIDNLRGLTHAVRLLMASAGQ